MFGKEAVVSRRSLVIPCQSVPPCRVCQEKTNKLLAALPPYFSYFFLFRESFHFHLSHPAQHSVLSIASRTWRL